MKIDAALREHLLRNYSLTEKELNLLLGDLADYWGRTREEFIRSRHLTLQRAGHKNETIYARIQQELKERRFASDDLSLRQIRRIIYG